MHISWVSVKAVACSSTILLFSKHARALLRGKVVRYCKTLNHA